MDDDAEAEFQCRAINDYYASVTDELDLKEGQHYTIMQTSPSGWWYAVNDDGEDGWVPSNYLERIDDADGAQGGQGGGQAPQAQEEEPQQQYNDPPEAKQDQIQAQPQQQVQQQPQQQQIGVVQQQVQQPPPANVAAQNDMVKAQPAQYNNVVDQAPDKPITQWNVEETLGYLQHAVTLPARNDFKLTQACRYLTQLATEPDECSKILSFEGLDIIFSVMKETAGDVAIQMSCCAATVVLCANPSSKQYPAKTNGIYYISQGIKDNLNYGPFVILAFNAVCNFCHDHPIHRAMALDTDIVDQIIGGMNFHRGKNEGYRVHSAGCLALRNIAAEPKGQAAVGPDGVSTIVNGLEEYRQMREVVEGSMGVLCNLCALPANGEGFVMNGGIRLLDSLYSDPESGENVRLAAASVLHNLAANPDTALLLSSDEGIDLLVKILKKADIESPLFLNTLKVLAALLFKLPEDNKPGGNKKPDVMQRIIQKGLLATLNEAIKYENKELQEMCATILVVIAQTKSNLAQMIADADSPAQLIAPCQDDPTPQTFHCSVAIWFHVCDAFPNQKRLIDNGVLNVLCSKWYENENVKDDTLRICCGVFIKLCSNVRNAAAFNSVKDPMNAYISYCRQNKPQLEDLLKAIEGAMRNMDPMATGGMHVQQEYKQVKQEAPQQQQKVANDEKQAEPEPAQQPQEVKQIARQSKVSNADSYQANVQTVPATASASTHNETAPDSAPDTGGKFYSLADLQSGKAKVPANSKEAYLSDEDFEKHFGMSKEAFYAARPWKQKSLKQKLNLW